MSKKREMTVWYGHIDERERYPDVPYWQEQPVEKKFAAAWQMVIEAHKMKGEDLSESRLQRSIAHFQRVPR